MVIEYQHTQVELKPTYHCNSNCRFCLFEDRKEPRTMTRQEVKENLAFIKSHFQPRVFVLSGGEPTILPYFFFILEFAIQELQVESVRVHTNLRKFADPSFVKRMPPFHYRFVVSLHSTDQATHDWLTRRQGAFAQVMNGMRNLQELDSEMHVVTLILRQNTRQLPAIVKLLALSSKVDMISFRFPVIQGWPQPDRELLVPEYAEVKDYLMEAIGQAQSRGIFVVLENCPDCYLHQVVPLPEGHKWGIYAFFDKTHQLENYSLANNQLESVVPDVYERYEKLEECCLCHRQDRCKGIPPGYRVLGFNAIYPIPL